MEKIEYFPGFGGAYLCLQVPAVQKAHSTAAPAKRPGLHQVWCLFLSFLSQILYFILLQDLVLEFPFCFSKGLIVHSKTNASRSVAFPLFLCIDCWRRLSYLFLLFFGTLRSDVYIFLATHWKCMFWQCFASGPLRNIVSSRLWSERWNPCRWDFSEVSEWKFFLATSPEHRMDDLVGLHTQSRPVLYPDSLRPHGW